MKKANKLPRLTLKTAKELIKQELGVHTTDLTRQRNDVPEGSYKYEMPLGKLIVTVDNDWYGKSGCFRLTIDTNDFCTGWIRKYFNADTLEEDISAEYEVYIMEREEQTR